MLGTDMPPTRNLWTRWVRFWFTPVDPTTMGFIRLVTGLIAVYVHLAYTFDLQSFFGPNAWYGLEDVNRERRSVPHLIPPLSWEDTRSTARLPEFPHRREATLRYLRDLGTRPKDRVDAELKWMDRLLDTNNGLLFATGMGYVLELSPDPVDRALQLDVLKDEGKRGLASAAVKPPYRVMATPLAVVGLPPDKLIEAAAEVELCYQGLPKDATDREYVVNHLRELDPASRLATVRFMKKLPSLSPAEREAELTYLENWNLERRLTGRVGNPIFSIWFHVTDPVGMTVAHTVMLVIFVLFAIGLWTRVTSVLAWLAAVSYIHRSQQVLFGMDTMLNILLFYLMFADAGAALSVDRLIKRYRAAKLSLARTGGIDAPTAAYLRQPPVNAASGFAQRLVQVHFCFIYMAAALSKLKGQSWWSHHAYWDTLVNPEFTLIQYQWYESIVREMVSVRPIYAVMAAMGIAVTFIAELGLPFLVWTRKRPYIVIFGFVLHAGVAVFMGLWIFSLLMMTLLLSYLPGAAIRAQLFGASEAVTARLRLPDRKPETVHGAALLAALDASGSVEVGEAVRGDSPEKVRAALPWLARRLSAVRKLVGG